MPAKMNLLRSLICVLPALGFGWAVASVRYIVGYWPLATDQLRLAVTALGIVSGVAAAWITSAEDIRYHRAVAAGRARFLAHLLGAVSLVTILALVTITSFIAVRVYGATAGGNPPWWFLPTALAWLSACIALGALIGAHVRRRAPLAVALGLLAMLVLTFANTRRGDSPWAPATLFTWDMSTEFIRLVPEPGALAATIITALLVMAACVTLLLRGSSPLAALGVLLLVFALGSGITRITAGEGPEAGQLRARPLPAHLTCTGEHQGRRLCSWPENRYGVEQLDRAWPQLVDFFRRIDHPLPKGTIVTTGLEDHPEANPDFTMSGIYTLPDVDAYNLATEYLRREIADLPAGTCDENLDADRRWIAVELAAVAQILYVPASTGFTYDFDLKPSIVDWVSQVPEEEAIRVSRDIARHFFTCDPSDEWGRPWAR